MVQAAIVVVVVVEFNAYLYSLLLLLFIVLFTLLFTAVCLRCYLLLLSSYQLMSLFMI